MKIILKHCKNVFIITLYITSNGSKEIIQWFNDYVINSTYKNDNSIITV